MGSSAKWRSPKAFIPSLKDSSAPAERRMTRTPGTGGSARRFASASRETTAVPLSLAPGTTLREPISAIAAVEAAASPVPNFVSALIRVSAPSATSSGPPTTGAISAGLVSIRSIRPRRSAICGSAGWKTRPEWAESWWAETTIVRAASGSPISQTTL